MMSKAAETVRIHVVDKSKLPESSKATRTKSATESAVKAVGLLADMTESLVSGEDRDRLTGQFEEEVRKWGNDVAGVEAINRFTWTYRNYLRSFKEHFRPGISLAYLESVRERRKGEGLADFIGDICTDVGKGGKAWEKARKRLMAFGDPRKEKFLGGEMTNARELVLGALVEGYLKASGEFSDAESEEEIIRSRDARGRYAMAIAQVCKGMPGMHRLDQQKVSGALHTIAEGLGVWKAPETT